MKKLSDYKGDEALDLWADLLEPMSAILGDQKVLKLISSGKSPLFIAKTLLATHKKEVVEIMQRIDPEPLDGLNIILRLVAIIQDVGQNEEIKAFFGFAEQAKTGAESGGSPTANIGDAEK